MRDRVLRYAAMLPLSMARGGMTAGYHVSQIVADYFARCDESNELLPVSPALLAAKVTIDGVTKAFGELTADDLVRMATVEGDLERPCRLTLIEGGAA